jgi:hypothetical protein
MPELFSSDVAAEDVPAVAALVAESVTQGSVHGK